MFSEGITTTQFSCRTYLSKIFFREGHYGVYGCNIFAEDGARLASTVKPIFINKEVIFGDAFLMVQWSDDHNHPNCSDPRWECFAAVSEFDYLFVCTDPHDPCFGGTRWIVNNCYEDKKFTEPPFDNFVERLEAYAHLLEMYGGDQDAILDLQFVTCKWT